MPDKSEVKQSTNQFNKVEAEKRYTVLVECWK